MALSGRRTSALPRPLLGQRGIPQLSRDAAYDPTATSNGRSPASAFGIPALPESAVHRHVAVRRSNWRGVSFDAVDGSSAGG
jgi:hypothetical protein